MAAFERFRFATLAELRTKVMELGVDLSLAEDHGVLAHPVDVGPYRAPNALATQPMEGADGTAIGEPDQLTFRRYRRYAEGGAGLIWFEATAVNRGGCANARQLCLTEQTLPAFARLVEHTLAAARQACGGREPVLVLQLTHSGRMSKPIPVIGHHHPRLDAFQHLPAEYPVITDDELDRLGEDFVRAAALAKRAGFHAVDVKACHGYLFSELLSARTRPGRYGGDFAGRTRIMVEIMRGIRQTVGDSLVLGTRLDYYNGAPYPDCWGADRDDPEKLDLVEPLALTKQLMRQGLGLVNVTIRRGLDRGRRLATPSNEKPSGGSASAEHPLEGVARYLGLAGAVQAVFPSLVVTGTGYSYLRQFVGEAAAGHIGAGRSRIATVGRLALAYPDFARDLLQRGALDRRQVCLTCGKCFSMLQAGVPTGCVVRDSALYVPFYRQLTATV